MSQAQSGSRRRALAACVVVALIAGACSGGAAPETTTTTTATTVATTTSSTTSTTVGTTTTTAPTTTTSTIPPLPPLPPELAAQIDELIAITEELRGRSFLTPPMIEVLTPEEVTERRREGLEEDLDAEELQPEGALYELFSILPPDSDLYSFYTDFFSSGTLAYYDLEEQRLVVPLAGSTLNEYEKWILVHELTHALMDQHFPEVADRYEESGDDGDFDEIGGLLGLLEGEAVLIQSLYLESLDAEARAEVVRIGGERSNPTFAAAPFFFREMIRFPYTAGSVLAFDLYRRGGVVALDQAFAEPPRSTEQVLHPDRYIERHNPLELDLIEVEVAGYEQSESGAWGERGWRVLLDHHLGSSASAQAADGWGGDQYEILWNEDTEEVVFVVIYEADSFGDASEFAGALEDFVEEGMDVGSSETDGTSVVWSGDDYAFVQRGGNRVVFVAAGDPAAGQAAVDDLFAKLGG